MLRHSRGDTSMKALKGTRTHENLKAAFAGESQANRRYLYFAAKADVEGQNDVSALFRSTAEGETGHAHGHLEYLEAVGDPATNLPIGRTRDNLKAAVAGETHEYTDMYPGMAKQARDEGFRDDGGRRRCKAGLLEGRRPVLPVRHVLHDEVPVRAAASLERRLPAPDAAREGDQVPQRHQVARPAAVLHRCARQARRDPGGGADRQCSKQERGRKSSSSVCAWRAQGPRTDRKSTRLNSVTSLSRMPSSA